MPVIWMTGLPGSGKTTVGLRLVGELSRLKIKATLLDGDVLRKNLCADLGFSDEDRLENIRRIAWTAKLLQGEGYIVVVATISPLACHRALAHSIIGDGFCETFVSASVEICSQRDPKGMYADAINGKIPGFTGISGAYEAPVDPDLMLDTTSESVEESIWTVLDLIHRLTDVDCRPQCCRQHKKKPVAAARRKFVGDLNGQAH